MIILEKKLVKMSHRKLAEARGSSGSPSLSLQNLVRAAA
jgi:hypothetical protein